MLVLLSPAKNMADATGEGLPLTGPVFLPETGPILRALRAYSPWQLESLMKVNPEIALKTFDFTKSSTRPCLVPRQPSATTALYTKIWTPPALPGRTSPSPNRACGF